MVKWDSALSFLNWFLNGLKIDTEWLQEVCEQRVIMSIPPTMSSPQDLLLCACNGSNICKCQLVGETPFGITFLKGHNHAKNNCMSIHSFTCMDTVAPFTLTQVATCCLFALEDVVNSDVITCNMHMT